MNPPLRTREDVEAIIQGLKDGTIDILSTDHAPHSAEEKKQDFIHAPMGIVGLETAFSLAVTNLVVPGHLTIQELVGMMSYRPAKRLGIQGGVLAEQETANITIVNPKEKYVLREEDLHSKSKNTPFLGKKMQGRVCCTIVNGEIKFRR